MSVLQSKAALILQPAFLNIYIHRFIPISLHKPGYTAQGPMPYDISYPSICKFKCTLPQLKWPGMAVHTVMTVEICEPQGTLLHLYFYVVDFVGSAGCPHHVVFYVVIIFVTTS